MAQKKELVIQTWGGALTEAQNKAFFAPFEKETGIKIVVVEAGGDLFGKVATQVRSGHVEWDLCGGYYYPAVETAAAKGLLEPIDYKFISNATALIPSAVKKWGVGQQMESLCIAYNYNTYKGDDYPKSWADFFNVEKFPGPRAMNNWGGHVENMVAALLADGVPFKEIRSIDYERAFKKLDQIKSHIKVWYTSGDQLMKAMLDEEVVLAQSTDGRTKAAKKLGATVNHVWNEGLFYITYWNIVKGAPNKEAALQFLDFICRPEQQAILVEQIGYSSTNPKLIDFLDPEIQKDQSIYPSNLSKQYEIPGENFAQWVTDHRDEISEKWYTWIAK